jgi:molybdate-binding protein/DNA-binding XRE family transcriptional regulator
MRRTRAVRRDDDAKARPGDAAAVGTAAEPAIGRSAAIRARRIASGLAQAQLAERVGISRQSLVAIEAGRVSPSVDVALALSAALGATVEDLFSTPRSPWSWAVLASDARGARVHVTHVDGRAIAHPMAAPDDFARANATLHEADRQAEAGASVRVSLLDAARMTNAHGRGESESRTLGAGTSMIAGCAFVLDALATRLSARRGVGSVVWISASSTTALDLLARGHIHVAGHHLHASAATSKPARAPGRRRSHSSRQAGPASASPAVMNAPRHTIAVGHWTCGLVVARGNPHRVTRLSDVARPRLRLITRETGSAARRTWDDALETSLSPREFADVQARAHVVDRHLDVGRAIARGFADVGIATQDTAQVCGLDFVPLHEERFDLVLHTRSLDDPTVQRVLHELSGARFREELRELGWDTRATGTSIDAS